jgi:hypothetical protein
MLKDIALGLFVFFPLIEIAPILVPEFLAMEYLIFRISVDILLGCFQFLGPEAVIGVEETDIVAARLLDPGIARSCRTFPFLVKVADALVLVASYELSGIIGRAVIDNDQLKVFVGLIQYRPQRHLQEVFSVIGRNHHTKKHLSFCLQCMTAASTLAAMFALRASM